VAGPGGAPCLFWARSPRKGLGAKGVWVRVGSWRGSYRQHWRGAGEGEERRRAKSRLKSLALQSATGHKATYSRPGFVPSWARPAPRGWSEAVEPPYPEVNTRGFAAKYSHRLYGLFLQSSRILLFGVA
jgi:hypothetical protein